MCSLDQLNVLTLVSRLIAAACQRNRLNATALSNKLFTAPVVDDTLTSVQITGLRGGRLPATRLFYSTVSNNNFNQNPALPPVQPTFPTNSLFRGNDRRRKAPKKSLRNRKGCLSCLTDFKNKPYTHNDVCLNPLRNTTEAESRFFNVCPETSEFCQIEVFTVNGVFSGMERRCSTICKPVCFQR